MTSDASAAPLTWLHIGTGAFHRAHQAFYLDRLRIDGRLDPWRLVVGNIKPDLLEVERALSRGPFTLETVTPDGDRAYVEIASIASVAPWRPDLRPLIDAGADPGTRVVSFTVTEAGYHLGPDGRLDPTSSDLSTDLSSGAGATIYGVVARILEARMEAASAGLTLLCCDNLRENGDRFRGRLAEFLELRGDRDLQSWIEGRVTFPNCMVDRITPRPTADLRERVEARTGADDAAAVSAEAYVQWVVEDAFAAGRPPLEIAGVELVASVRPYEEAKIRILNGSHALLAWRGAALGLTYIHDCVARAELREAVHRYVTDDVIPSLPDSPLDLPTYRDTVIDRFSNRFIGDTVSRVASDGFAKFPSFVVPTIRERLNAGADACASMAIAAAFLRFLQLWRVGALAFQYQDQSMRPEVVRTIVDAKDPVSAFVGNGDLWGDLSGRPGLAEALHLALID